MKISGLILFCLLPFSISSSIDTTGDRGKFEEVSNKLNEVDDKFKREGATLDILSEYDSVISDFQKLLTEEDTEREKEREILLKVGNIRYKHGIINLILKRQKLALEDFESCVIVKNDHGEEFIVHQGCFSKFADIGLKFGHHKDILDKIGYLEEGKMSKLINAKELERVKDSATSYIRAIQEIEGLMQIQDWSACVDRSNELIEIGTNDDRLIRGRIECLSNIDYGFDEQIKLLSGEYNKLVNSEINNINLADFVSIGEIELFGISDNYKLECDKIIKKCLKIDNDFLGCRNLNRINLKIHKMIQLIKDVSIYYSFIYSDTAEVIDSGRIEDVEVGKEKWREINRILFDEQEKLRIKNGLDRRSFEEVGIDVADFRNNFEILVQLFFNIFEKNGFAEDKLLQSRFLADLFRLGKQSYFEIGEFKNFKNNPSVSKNRYYLKAEKGRQKDIVDICRELDHLLRKKKMDKVQGVLDSLSKSMKTSSLIKEREAKFNEYQEAQRRQQQQQQQQQHFRQQRFQNGGGHGGARQAPPKPKNDYYKVLGIARDADADEIKRAYRQKMRENHPDKVKQQLKKDANTEFSEEELENRVAEINNAYEILSDPEKRSNYDHHGDDPNDPENAHRQQQHHQQQHGGGHRQYHFNGFPNGFPNGFGGFNFHF